MVMHGVSYLAIVCCSGIAIIICQKNLKAAFKRLIGVDVCKWMCTVFGCSSQPYPTAHHQRIQGFLVHGSLQQSASDSWPALYSWTLENNRVKSIKK